MAALEMNNCDDCVVNVPFDLAFELTKIYYSCDRNKANNYYKSDIIEAYKYFKKELEGKDDTDENEDKERSRNYDFPDRDSY